MARALALDTSGRESAAILLDGDRLVAGVTWRRTSGEEPVLSRLQGLLKEAAWELAAVERIAVARGPGSFTGLRVGLSICMGLAYGRGLPLHLLESLAIVGGRAGDAATVVLRDAGHGEFYAWRPPAEIIRLAGSAVKDWLRPGDRPVVDPPGSLGRWAPQWAGREAPGELTDLEQALRATAIAAFENGKPVRYHEVDALYAQPAAARERPESKP